MIPGILFTADDPIYEECPYCQTEGCDYCDGLGVVPHECQG